MNFSVGDLLVLNIIKAPQRWRDCPRNGIIISVDRERKRIGIRWTCYDGTSRIVYTWHHLEEMIDRKTMEWYPV